MLHLKCHLHIPHLFSRLGFNGRALMQVLFRYVANVISNSARVYECENPFGFACVVVFLKNRFSNYTVQNHKLLSIAFFVFRISATTSRVDRFYRFVLQSILVDDKMFRKHFANQ